MITFQSIMEPVFDKLGMRLVSRNMGMGGVGTLQFTLAGGDLYGETDVILWDSGMTEKGAPVDLFNKQAILSGERVPVILSDYHFNVMEETNNTAWMGKYLADTSMMPETTLENQDSIPFAARWFNEEEEKYSAICWEPRADFTPAEDQDAHPGSQVGWHPGNRHHQWSGRKLALVILRGLSEAFDTWEKGVQEEGCPLAESYWHVRDSYKTIRDNLRTHITTPNKDDNDEDIRSPCEKTIPWLPRICRIQMHGFGMWNPRAHVEYDLLNILHPAPNGYKPDFRIQNVYDGFDLLPLSQAIPEGEVDVHAIAIATRNPPPDLDHSWIEKENNGTDEDAATVTGTDESPPTRRQLRASSERAFQAGMIEETPPGLKHRSRRLDANDIVPGRGWEVSLMLESPVPTIQWQQLVAYSLILLLIIVHYTPNK
jgi:hypothetical protein